MTTTTSAAPIPVLPAWRVCWAHRTGLLAAFYDHTKPQKWWDWSGNVKLHPYEPLELASCRHGHPAPNAKCTCGVHAVTAADDLVPFGECLDVESVRQLDDVYPALVRIVLLDAIPGAHTKDEGVTIRREGGRLGIDGDPPSTYRGREGRIVGPIAVASRSDVDENRAAVLVAGHLEMTYRVPARASDGTLGDLIRAVAQREKRG